jgi:hypothetical protein
MPGNAVAWSRNRGGRAGGRIRNSCGRSDGSTIPDDRRLRFGLGGVASGFAHHGGAASAGAPIDRKEVSASRPCFLRSSLRRRKRFEATDPRPVTGRFPAEWRPGRVVTRPEKTGGGPRVPIQEIRERAVPGIAFFFGRILDSPSSAPFPSIGRARRFLR